MISVKNVKFFFLFLCKQRLEKMFGDVLDRKQAFPEYQNISFV